MTSKHIIKVSVLANFFDCKQLQWGENAVESGHIVEMHSNLNQTPAVLTGTISASMKNKIYNVEIHIDKEDGIVKASCTCHRKHVSCHHMAALCIYARDNVNITDAQCTWNVSKETDESPVQTIEDLYPPKRPGYRAIETEISEEAIERFRKSLSTLDQPVGFTWLLNARMPDVDEEMTK